MLSYRHSFHAGNHADVLKHITLSLLLEAMNGKDKPYVYIDSHSGAGCYSLRSEHAKKTAEFETGISRIWQANNPPAELDSYLHVIKQYNRDGHLNYYPGSPLFAKTMMRPHDHIILNEIHPTDSPLLKREFLKDSRAHLNQIDGFHLCREKLPPQPRRGLILMDPSYEMPNEYDQVCEAIKNAQRRWETGTFALWYPVVDRNKNEWLERKIKQLVQRPTLLVEMAVAEDSEGYGMTASGMIIINPPWKLFEQLECLLPWLCDTLQVENNAKQRLEWLRKEA